jgi:hypothetical protein
MPINAQDVHVDHKPKIMNVAESSLGDLRLFVDHMNGIRMYDFNTGTVEDVTTPGITHEALGAPIDSVLMAGSVVSCYTSTIFYYNNYVDFGIIQGLDFKKDDIKQILTWRHPLSFSGTALNFSLLTQ